MDKPLALLVGAGLAMAGMAALPPSATAAEASPPIEVGLSPVDAAVSPDGGRAYVANRDTGDVSVLSLADGSVVNTVEVEAGAAGVALTPDGTRAYVASTTGSVSIIDTASGAIIDSLALDGQPTDAAVTPDGRYVFIPRREADKVSVLSVRRGVQVAEIDVGSTPTSVAITSDGSRAYVADYASDTVSVINTATLSRVATIPVGDGPIAVAAAPDQSRGAYVAEFLGGSISVITDILATDKISGLAGPAGVAVAADGKTVYATQSAEDTLAAVSPATGSITAATPVGDSPRGVAVSADGSRAVVANRFSNTATTIRLAPRTETLPASGVDGKTARGRARIAADADPVVAVQCYYSTDPAEPVLGPTGSAPSVAASPSTLAPGVSADVTCPFDRLRRGTTYYYVAAAADGDGYGWRGPAQQFTTAPGKPSDISLRVKRKALVWRWGDVAAAEYYQTRLRKKGRWKRWKRTTRPKVRYGNVRPETRYKVQIRAVNDAGPGPVRTKRAKTR